MNINITEKCKFPKNTFSKYVYSVYTFHELFLITVDLTKQIMHFLHSFLTFRSETKRWPTMTISILDTSLRTQLIISVPFPPAHILHCCPLSVSIRKTVTIFNIKQYLTDDFSSKNSLEEWSSWLR
jgi:hypothetical protein